MRATRQQKLNSVKNLVSTAITEVFIVSPTIQSQIEARLRDQINPTHLEVVDESWQHGGGAGAQSHYKVIIVAEQFQGQKLLARHRSIQNSLADIITRIRALSLHTLTPEEWSQASENSGNFRSPGCHNR